MREWGEGSHLVSQTRAGSLQATKMPNTQNLRVRTDPTWPRGLCRCDLVKHLEMGDELGSSK